MTRKVIWSVDHEPASRDTVCNAIQQLEGYCAQHRHFNEPELLLVELARTRELPDLIISEFGCFALEGFDYQEMVRLIKADPIMNGIPVMVLTTRGDDVTVYAGWQSGVDCYLCKPSSPFEVGCFIRRIFRTIDEEGDEDG